MEPDIVGGGAAIEENGPLPVPHESSCKIRDQIDEIYTFRKARVLTMTEAVYRTAGFNDNIHGPPVSVCPFQLPRGRYTLYGELGFDDSV